MPLWRWWWVEGVSNCGVLISAFTLILLLGGQSRFLIDLVPGLGASELAAIRLFLVGAVDWLRY